MILRCHPTSCKRDSSFREPQLKRPARSKLLLKQFKNGTLQNVIFTDEKLFTVQQAHNHQNDRVLAKTFDSIPANTRKVFRTQKPASVIVWTAISEKGKSPLFFFYPRG